MKRNWMVELALAFVVVFTLTRLFGSMAMPGDMAKGMMVIALVISGVLFSADRLRGWWKKRRPPVQ